MITRRTKVHLVVFTAMATSGVAYVGAKYAGLEDMVGTTSYTVSMDLADSGGIFTNAEVTYEGVTVGRVGELHPTDEGVTVDLLIQEDAEAIPADGLEATVKNLSIIGEPYVDLTATTKGAPYLDDGSEIAVEQTATPVAPSVLLAGLDDLLTSVPHRSLRVVLRELDRAFAGTGPDLGRLLDNTGALVASAEEVLPETTALIRDGAVVLRTQNDEADSIVSFSRDLRLLAHQLKESDADLRGVIANGPAASAQTIAFLDETGAGLSQLIADLLTTGRLTEPRNAALRQLLITYPALARAAYSAVPGDGTAHFGLVLNAFDPLPCTRGYESTPRRSGSETADIPVNTQATCLEPRGSAIDVRGSHNVPRAGVTDEVLALYGFDDDAVRSRQASDPSLFVTDPTQILEDR
ncbi:MCE family protein [Nocardioides humilatus]|uniref:MCE family protein n=1 Tax=Nocardioides humilatus TaxID=2607660 RepID=A0A5B1LJW4_9ACTN|nr:MlaD family protein [Nocardioides humilatus]KAA1420972.1 MCE family protein [Nocardioides humilatus]